MGSVFQKRKKHKRAVIGTGLGLFIVKKIIELHGGEYGVTTEIEKGSTFWFELNID
jgi:signal transduction histidine kinase